MRKFAFYGELTVEFCRFYVAYGRRLISFFLYINQLRVANLHDMGIPTEMQASEHSVLSLLHGNVPAQMNSYSEKVLRLRRIASAELG
jgi:hypothetical protein